MAYHHGDLRRALLQGAIELLAEGGPANLTMRGAAQRAGVSPAAPYRHFTDKREMLAAVAEEGFLALGRACDEALAAGDRGRDPVEAIWRHGVAYVSFAIDNPAHYRVMFGPEIPDKRAYEGLYRAATTAYEGLRTSLRVCVAAGYFDDHEIEVRAMRAWAVVHGLASLFIDGQFNVAERISREAFLERAGAVLRLEAAILEKGNDALPRGTDPAV